MKRKLDIYSLPKLYQAKKVICVFCASSDNIDDVYKKEAFKLGELIAKNDFLLVHGGGKIGLMKYLSEGAQKHGGKVIGILPESLNIEGIASETDDELIITSTVAERKFEMRKRADAFIVLPGGFGTVEEFFETVTLKQLNYHNKLIVLVNINNYFTKLMDFLKDSVDKGFVLPEHFNLFIIVNNVEDAIIKVKEYFKNK
ncbi:MAG: TIGR00730 family Rossman fold protein [Bacteroidales bacterium]|nr:TIGR00730 family Rossman fold protein [Bacteroidales bacterium]